MKLDYLNNLLVELEYDECLSVVGGSSSSDLWNSWGDGSDPDSINKQQQYVTIGGGQTSTGC